MFLEIKICGTEKHNCHEFATCIDTGPGAYMCTCNKGYTGDGKTCTGMEKLKTYASLNFSSVF